MTVERERIKACYFFTKKLAHSSSTVALAIQQKPTALYRLGTKALGIYIFADRSSAKGDAGEFEPWSEARDMEFVSVEDAVAHAEKCGWYIVRKIEL